MLELAPTSNQKMLLFPTRLRPAISLFRPCSLAMRPNLMPRLVSAPNPSQLLCDPKPVPQLIFSGSGHHGRQQHFYANQLACLFNIRLSTSIAGLHPCRKWILRGSYGGRRGLERERSGVKCTNQTVPEYHQLGMAQLSLEEEGLLKHLNTSFCHTTFLYVSSVT